MATRVSIALDPFCWYNEKFDGNGGGGLQEVWIVKNNEQQRG